MTATKVYRPSPKAILAYKTCMEYKITLLEGAVRSSKSYTADQAFLDRCMKCPNKGAFVISGKASTTAKRNVLSEWQRKLGEKKFKFHKMDDAGYWTINHNGLRGKKFYIVGGGKAKDEDKIQGLTVIGWYADEAVLHTKEFISQMGTRLSDENSFAIWTANPNSPNHFIKTDYIDKQDELNEGGKKFFKSIKFTLEDNPSLSDDYRSALGRFYTGVFYRRFILGDWVTAEGAIYNMFDKQQHVVDIDKFDFSQYNKICVGVDYGYNNATTFLFVAQRHDGKLDVLDEWYWSGKENKTEAMDDYKMAQKMDEFLKSISVKIHENRKSFPIVVDPSASSFIAMLRRPDFGYVVRLAKNDVLNGIRDVQAKLSQNKLRINSKCIKLIEEFEGYAWDEEASLRKGVDVPLKINDHMMDNIKYCCATIFPEKWSVR